MKVKYLRYFALCAIFAFLCIGALFQYMNLDKNQYANAVMVMAAESIGWDHK